MVESYEWVIYKESEVSGCVMEDGADTRKYTEKILLIPENREEEYNESCADNYGYQDYSYQFSSKKIAELDHNQLMEISYKWIMSLTLHDILHNKDEFKKIADKINHCLKELEKEDN